MRGMDRPSSANDPGPRDGAASEFTWPVRVYYEDTDAGGIVFYANYLKFFERARTEWLRACGVDQQRLVAETGALFVVRSTALDYRVPARLDDLIVVESRIERIGRASVDFMQEAWRDGTLLATGGIRVACVERATLRPTPIPSHVLQALQHGPVKESPIVSTAGA